MGKGSNRVVGKEREMDMEDGGGEFYSKADHKRVEA